MRPISGGIARIVARHAFVAFAFVASMGQAIGESKGADVRVGPWIWSSEFHDRQECRFVRSFEIPSGAEVTSALLRVTADNSYELFLDGQPVGRGSDWRVLTEYDIKLLLNPGTHVLAVRVLNDFDYGGLVLGLRIVLDDGRKIEIAADNSWKIAPNDSDSWMKRTRAWQQWPAATITRPYRPGSAPRVYRALPTKPMELSLWERRWFQITLSLLGAGSVVIGLFLASRLLLNSQMEKVVRRERSRIALDLHDGLGGGLTQLVLLGETSRREVPPGSPTADALGRLCDQSRSLMRGMNETVWLINSERDTVRDFASYVMKYAESFFQATPVRCRFDLEEDLPPLPCDLGVRRNLFLAVKEACNNILKHSGASLAEVSIRRKRHDLVITIRDNGGGFVPAEATMGNGLRNMRQRVGEAGGRLKVISQPGNGCVLEFRVPLWAPTRVGAARFFAWKRRSARTQCAHQ